MQLTRSLSTVREPGALAFIAVLLVAGGCGNGDARQPLEPAPASGPRLPFLERATEALGGRERLTAIRSFATGIEQGRPLHARVIQELPGRYRQDVDTCDARQVLAIDGQVAWASLDDVPVPLVADEIEHLREQVLLGRLSFLVGLDDPDVRVEDLGLTGGLRWIEVTFEREGFGPYRLGFDPETALVRQAAWETTSYGHRWKVRATLTFEDYRLVDGIMVPFKATHALDGLELAVTRVEQVVFNPELAASVFQQAERPDRPVIIRRPVAPLRAALLEGPDLDPAGANRELARFVDRDGVIRNGPEFRVVGREDGVVTALGMPVKVTGVQPELGEGKGPAIRSLPGYEALTLVIQDPRESEREAARTRLLDEARLLSLKPAGPFREVVWSGRIEQVQLPVREPVTGEDDR